MRSIDKLTAVRARAYLFSKETCLYTIVEVSILLPCKI